LRPGRIRDRSGFGGRPFPFPKFRPTPHPRTPAGGRG
jgi:hypothetical protein